MSPVDALDRDALYYPYIHIHDANWLKATLLCFPKVRRIVPRWFPVVDSLEVAEFAELEGPRGPLLDSANLDTASVIRAQHELINKIEADLDCMLARYSHPATFRELGTKSDSFQIHSQKVLPDLAEFLLSKDLAWRSRDPFVPDSYLWLSVHPRMGKALMGTLAVSVARASGLSIVTPDDDAHRDLVRNPEEDPFAVLLRGTIEERAPRREDLIDEVTEVAITTMFDLKRLTPRNILDLINDGKDLRRFKQAVAPIAAEIPDIVDATERKMRLEAATDEIRTEWDAYRRSLPRFAAEALLDASDVKMPEILGSMLSGSTSAWHFGVGAGLAITFLSYSAVNISRRYIERRRSPYRYLSRIYEIGATLQGTSIRRRTAPSRQPHLSDAQIRLL
jgi:hypothetical protein